MKASLVRAAAFLVVLFFLLRAGLGQLGAGTGRATLIAAATVALLAGATALSARRITGTVFRGTAAIGVLVALWAAAVGVYAVGALLSMRPGPPSWVALPLGAVIVVAAALIYRRRTALEVDRIAMEYNEVEPRTAEQAGAMVTAARRAVAARDPRGSRHVIAQLNLARALIWLSTLDDQPRVLAEARQIIEGLAHDTRVDPLMRLSAAADLFGAVDSYAKETGDGTDYPAVMRLFEDLARGHADAAPLVHEQRADYAVFLAEAEFHGAGTAVSEEERFHAGINHLETALEELTTTLAVATDADFRSATSVKRAMLDTQLAVLYQPWEGTRQRLEDNEQICRDAVRDLAKRDPRRYFAAYCLLNCLIQTADWLRAAGQAGAGERYREAESLCQRLLAEEGALQPALLEMLSRILAAREDLGA